MKKNENQIKELKGIGIYKGKVSGVARVIKTEKDLKHFKEGDILVTQKVTVKQSVILEKAKAILSQTGGILSHAALLCREYKIPTITNIPNLLDYIDTGDFLTVDADNGIVQIKKKNKNS